MTLNLSKPILYLITRDVTVETTTPESEAFHNILQQVSSAVTTGIQLIQIREKRITARVLFELTSRAVAIARGSSTRILVNDRADIAAAAGADGVHLTTRSLNPDVIRKAFGDEFLIGASTHSLSEAEMARSEGADFAVFGPIFATPSKENYGAPLGVDQLFAAARQLTPFPLIALGGVSLENAIECLEAGAQGIAGITLFESAFSLASTAETIRDIDTTDLRRAAQ
jgi:thiamine-phosphate pyrophosphorylase